MDWNRAEVLGRGSEWCQPKLVQSRFAHRRRKPTGRAGSFPLLAKGGEGRTAEGAMERTRGDQ